MTDHHDLLLSDLVRFVADAAQQLRLLSCSAEAHSDSQSERETLRPPPRLEIPTAVVAAGETAMITPPYPH